jgi:hypothetical protein
LIVFSFDVATPMNAKTQPITSTEFFAAWVETCGRRFETLSRDWSNGPAFTAHIMDEPESVIRAVAKRLNRDLECYCGYYCIDAILFNKGDRVPDAPPGQTWVRGIRVAFEHENFFTSGLFQEISHLLITRCDLRVLVSYPDSDDDLAQELQRLRRVVSGSDQAESISETRSLLFITGGRDCTTSAIQWRGHVYSHGGWEEILA